MKRVVLLHGNGNSTGSGNWLPYIKAGLADLDIECVSPDLPDAKQARLKYWFPYFSEVLKLCTDDIIVGHSSGALSIMKYAEDNKIGASVLVATYFTDLGYESERASGYFDTSWQWDKIKANQNWSAIFSSADDPYIPISEPRFIRDQLGSEYYEFTDRGHFGGDANPVFQFPELLEFIRNKILQS
ncbi:MAG: alpha/beta fold hydrolase [Candidatus Saccharibacteria bacterium]